MRENDLIKKIDLQKLPKHIAIIMDGNGRWAQKRNLPRTIGHKEGINSVRKITEAAAKLGIRILTLFAFSTENWQRPKTEINTLFKLLSHYLKKEKNTLMKQNIKLKVIGNISKLPKNITKEIKETIELTKNNTGLILNIALNYGGRDEIIDSINRILKDKPESIDENDFEKYLFTAGLPDPDLLIRTSGEQRISNFLLWQIAYTELYFSPVLWPDFKTKEFYEAIIEFQGRERRFGSLN